MLQTVAPNVVGSNPISHPTFSPMFMRVRPRLDCGVPCTCRSISANSSGTTRKTRLWRGPVQSGGVALFPGDGVVQNGQHDKLLAASRFLT